MQDLKTVIQTLDPDLGAEGSCQRVLTGSVLLRSLSPSPFAVLLLCDFEWYLAFDEHSQGPPRPLDPRISV